jgi:proprotein convertase subtilisin/kexin type 5
VYGSTNCSLACPAGQYKVDYGNACQLCDTNCYTCDISSTNCTSCFLTSTGIRLYLQNYLCVQSCVTGTYPNASDNACYSCNIGCQVCSGPSLYECQACRDAVDPSNASNTLSYYLNIGNTICSLACPVGQYIRVGYPNACQACAVQCIGCSVASTNCTETNMCTLGYYYYRVTNSCITACPGTFYANSTTYYCEPCPGGCALCKAGSLLNCQQCRQDSSTGFNYYK